MSLKKRATKKSQSRSKSSQKWLKDHFDDVYVKQAQKAGYRSRAVYKLLEIQEKDHILKHGMTVVDLGAAPGGWSQVASKIVGSSGKVIALDILPIDSLAHVEFIQGDFTEPSVLDKLLEVLDGQEVSLVMSDMAPNISGIKVVDQPKAMYLAELALDLAQNVLCKNGNFLVKVFQVSGFDSYYKTLQSLFGKVITRKPKASKSNSREVYLLARGFLK
jgi:23S rRNA (uridine2552-2'-O)-methyltransferase